MVSPSDIARPAESLPTKAKQVEEANRLLREAGCPYRAFPRPRGRGGFALRAIKRELYT
jgi:hypothetical protein